VYHIAGKFLRSANFLWHAENKSSENFKSEVKTTLYHCFKTMEQTSTDVCLLLAPLCDGESTQPVLRKYKEQMEEISFIIFCLGDSEKLPILQG